jgi:hypothetical protein
MLPLNFVSKRLFRCIHHMKSWSPPNPIIVDDRSGTLPSNVVTVGRNYCLCSLNHPLRLLEGWSHRRQTRTNRDPFPQHCHRSESTLMARSLQPAHNMSWVDLFLSKLREDQRWHGGGPGASLTTRGYLCSIVEFMPLFNLGKWQIPLRL